MVKGNVIDIIIQDESNNKLGSSLKGKNSGPYTSDSIQGFGGYETSTYAIALGNFEEVYGEMGV